jgi:3-oxoacyl-[acyl-carrier protein] reductase/(S)-1-phenylethanol dehydrogenase
VNNAGIYPRYPFAEITLAQWQRVFAVNVESMMLLSQAVVPGMAELGRGRIINMTSNSVALVIPGITHYVAPSVTRTPGTTSMPAEAFEQLAQGQAIKRVEVPEDLAGVVAFLASDDAAFLTGQTLYVDGGMIS